MLRVTLETNHRTAEELKVSAWIHLEYLKRSSHHILSYIMVFHWPSAVQIKVCIYRAYKMHPPFLNLAHFIELL